MQEKCYKRDDGPCRIHVHVYFYMVCTVDEPDHYDRMMHLPSACQAVDAAVAAAVDVISQAVAAFASLRTAPLPFATTSSAVQKLLSLRHASSPLSPSSPPPPPPPPPCQTLPTTPPTRSISRSPSRSTRSIPPLPFPLLPFAATTHVSQPSTPSSHL